MEICNTVRKHFGWGTLTLWYCFIFCVSSCNFSLNTVWLTHLHTQNLQWIDFSSYRDGVSIPAEGQVGLHANEEGCRACLDPVASLGSTWRGRCRAGPCQLEVFPLLCTMVVPVFYCQQSLLFTLANTWSGQTLKFWPVDVKWWFIPWAGKALWAFLTFSQHLRFPFCELPVPLSI